MNLEKTIQSCFDYYPDLFQTREQVLNHLFCVIGNGYDWKNGELIDLECEKPLNFLDKNGKAKQYNNQIQYKINSSSIYPLCKKYSYLFNYSNDIKDDWLQGIKETYEYIIANINDELTFREITKEKLIQIYNEKFSKIR